MGSPPNNLSLNVAEHYHTRVFPQHPVLRIRYTSGTTDKNPFEGYRIPDEYAQYPTTTYSDGRSLKLASIAMFEEHDLKLEDENRIARMIKRRAPEEERLLMDTIMPQYNNIQQYQRTDDKVNHRSVFDITRVLYQLLEENGVTAEAPQSWSIGAVEEARKFATCIVACQLMRSYKGVSIPARENILS